MIQKNFDDINKEDIDYLVENKISEIKTIEYKQTLPGRTEKEKHEFLADVSSFANSSGGDIIYGIKEKVEDDKKTGQAEKIIPLKDTTANDAQLRLEDIIRSGIEPRLPVHIKPIEGYDPDGTGFVILVRIPQSFASPHMIKSSSRFYCRNSAGKYQLDVQEIRNAFLATELQAERIHNFLQDRLTKIIADETPVTLSTEDRLVLHIIPLNPFLNHQRLQLSSNKDLNSYFRPIRGSSNGHRYNLDGFITYDWDFDNIKLNNSYCLVFFNGVVEAVYSNILKGEGGKKPKKGETVFISSVAFVKYVIEAIEKYFKGYKELGIEAPAIVSMTLLGCKGAHLWTERLSSQAIDRNVAILPEVQVESFEEKVSSIMKPIFDAVWNACGFSHCSNYTENGILNVRL